MLIIVFTVLPPDIERVCVRGRIVHRFLPPRYSSQF
jgi:hypothetical protein